MFIPFYAGQKDSALYIGSYEMAQILSYLDLKGKIYDIKKALPYLKEIPGVFKHRRSLVYLAPKDSAWKYFQQNYYTEMDFKKPYNIEDLILKASMYAERSTYRGLPLSQVESDYDFAME